MSVVTRFAPSPTGSLHLGGLRTAIFNYLYAKKNQGKLILRIEDTDQERSTEGSLQEIITSLEWLGIEWDEGPYLQSSRLNIYTDFVNMLLDKDLAYKCFTTNEEIKELKEKAAKNKEIYRYPRIWRDRRDHPQNSNYVIRFKVPDLKEISFTDTLRGQINIDSSNLDDFVIVKSDGFPTYNFASVVDDADMGVTNIIRGEDHLSNTAKQMLIFDAIEKEPPSFTHVSMILGKDKNKLSKRHGAESINKFKDLGYLPIAIVNYLARLGWSHGDQEIFSMNEMVNFFSLENLSKSPAVFDTEKLEWVNSTHIKSLSNNVLKNLIGIKFYKDINIDLAIESTKGKSKTLVMLKDSLKFCENEYPEIDEILNTEIEKNQTNQIIKELHNNMLSLSDFSKENIKIVFDDLISKHSIKFKDIGLPLRIALTGSKVSPGIYELIEILGRDLTLKRIKKIFS